MTRPLEIRPSAQEEINEAYSWYESKRAGLGEEFLAALREGLTRIESNPEGYARLSKETRAALLKRFKYVVYFRADAELIVVMAVMRGNRDPRRWRRRE